MTALVTGGAGFIGSNLVDALAGRGERVRILDDLSTGRRQNLPPNVELLQGSITDAAAVVDAVKGVDVVYHLAAVVSVQQCLEEPVAANEVNVVGTSRILQAAAASDVRRVVFASSAAVYGDSPVLPKREELPPDPLSSYAVAKLAGEQLGRTVPGVEFVALRFFNVYGPRQNPKSQYAAAIPIFLTALEAGRPLPIFGDGTQTRDFTYVGDVVTGLLLAGDAGGIDGRVFNIAAGRAITVSDLAFALGRAAGRPVEFEFRPPRPGEILHSYGDISAAERFLGFQARVPLDEGLAETVKWFRGRRGD
ncbi:MAG TPA: NAD-dependent epimerase/dehydratase family protein [Planctomycetota bacterium]|jgi:UDP-glucose 4-epimerase